MGGLDARFSASSNLRRHWRDHHGPGIATFSKTRFRSLCQHGNTPQRQLTLAVSGWNLLGLVAGVLFCFGASAQDLRGHGGPIRAISIAPDGRAAITGSFDTSSIEWDLDSSVARSIFRKHEGSVNAVLALANSIFVTGGDDGRVAVWASGQQVPVRILETRDAPIAALAASPDGAIIASAGWDGDIHLLQIDGTSEPVVLKGHAGQVSALIYTPDGVLVSGAYDATIRFWKAGREIRAVQLQSPINKLALIPSGLIAACADGHLRIVSDKEDNVGDVELSAFPIVALAVSPLGDLVVAGSIDGRLIFVDPLKKTVLREHQSRGWPVWALAFTPDGRQFFSGGGDGLGRRWDVATGEPVGTATADAEESVPKELRQTRGAEVFKACSACHTLRDDEAPRAGPTLHRIMGRPIASTSNYTYSEAFHALNIVWGRDTIAKLFEIGPHAYTPGTKMPEQRLNPADREALVDFLDEATR